MRTPVPATRAATAVMTSTKTKARKLYMDGLNLGQRGSKIPRLHREARNHRNQQFTDCTIR